MIQVSREESRRERSWGSANNAGFPAALNGLFAAKEVSAGRPA